jgi:hypothetical protein
MPFRDLPTVCGGDTLAERYKQTMFRLERIVQAGYLVKVQWKCEFEPLEDTSVEENLPLRTRVPCMADVPRPCVYIKELKKATKR